MAAGTVALLLAAAPVAAEPTVSWTVPGPQAQHCLIASVPALTARDPSLPEAVEACYGQARRIVFATLAPARLDEVGYVELLGSLTGRNTAGNLPDSLEPELQDRFHARLTTLGLSADSFVTFRPWFAAQMVWAFMSVSTPARMDLGVERQLFRRSWKDRKEVVALESDQAHADIFAGMSTAAGIDQLRLVLDEKGPAAAFQRRIAGWRQGDLKGLERELIEMRRAYPAFYQTVYADRHRHWLPRLRALLDQDQPHAIVLDILHIAGPDGMLRLLEGEGRTPQPLAPRPTKALWPQAPGRSSR